METKRLIPAVAASSVCVALWCVGVLKDAQHFVLNADFLVLGNQLKGNIAWNRQRFCGNCKFNNCYLTFSDCIKLYPLSRLCQNFHALYYSAPATVLFFLVTLHEDHWQWSSLKFGKVPTLRVIGRFGIVISVQYHPWILQNVLNDFPRKGLAHKSWCNVWNVGRNN